MKNIHYLQERVWEWVVSTFGPEQSETRIKGYRFFEEAVELVESTGLTQEQCHIIVNYVFNRESPGETHQEIGGVMMTLAAYATANKHDIEICWFTELLRCERMAEQIRLKDENKPQEVKA